MSFTGVRHRGGGSHEKDNLRGDTTGRRYERQRGMRMGCPHRSATPSSRLYLVINHNALAVLVGQQADQIKVLAQMVEKQQKQIEALTAQARGVQM